MKHNEKTRKTCIGHFSSTQLGSSSASRYCFVFPDRSCMLLSSTRILLLAAITYFHSRRAFPYADSAIATLSLVKQLGFAL